MPTLIPRSVTLPTARRFVPPMILLVAALVLIAMTSGPALLTSQHAANPNNESEITISFSADCQTFTVTSTKELSFVRWTTDDPPTRNSQGYIDGEIVEFDDPGPHEYTNTVEVNPGETLTVQAKSGQTVEEASCTPGEQSCEDRGLVTDPDTGECMKQCPDGLLVPEAEECPNGTGGFGEAQLLNVPPLQDPLINLVSDGADTDNEGDEGLLNAILGPDFILPPGPCPLPVADNCGLLWESDNNDPANPNASTGVLQADMADTYSVDVITSDCGDAKLVEGEFMGTGGNLWDELDGGSGGALGEGLAELGIKVQQDGAVLQVDLLNTGALGNIVVGYSHCEG